MKNKFMKTLLTLVLLTLITVPSVAQETDITDAAILVSPSVKSPVNKTVSKMLIEEIKDRTDVMWQVSDSWKTGNNTVLAIALASDIKLAGKPVPQRTGSDLPEEYPEGYRILTEKSNDKNVIWIIAADARGALFGAGYLLRKANLSKGKVLFSFPANFATRPDQSIRGHQLGYRHIANSYDAWDAAQYEQYIRELVIFGSNAIENIPLNASPSPHMPISREEMNIRLGEICQAYDVDYWVWTPATFDLTDLEKRADVLKQHEEFYKQCPRLDQIFFPGGDPGQNHPRHVMPFLKDLSDLLVKYHPQAGVWISLQGFNAEQVDYFYTYLDENSPDWLRGIVSGPSSPPTAETHYRLPAKYKHRLYPDINHNVRCEYPVHNWDQAFALTIGREGTNPRPVYFSKIHKTYTPFIEGFVSYSDGVGDDVNKVIWNMRGWDIGAELDNILMDYGRFYFGEKLAAPTKDGIFALEHNWNGPIKTNGSIATTFEFWKKLEKDNPHLKDNWRWQMLVLRAYYDNYQRLRKIYETGLEDQANNILAQANKIGSEKAMTKALEIVNKADTEPVAQALYQKIVDYCDALFNSIGLQTSVLKHQAAYTERGCILELANYPLNNRWWLEDEFNKINKLPTENEKIARLDVIRNWENPGPSGYYDNVSDIAQSPHVLTTSFDACDVAWWDKGRSRKRLSAQLFQNELELKYENLDFNGRYILRLCGKGDVIVWIDGHKLVPVSYSREHGEFKEYVIPRQLHGDGQMHVVIDRPDESIINWRKYSHVSDVWLLKQ